VYLRARYYNPALGVFPSLDPVEFVNRYGYVDRNPINRVDPSGMIGEQPLNTCYTRQNDGGLLVNDCIQTCMNSSEMVERQAYPNHIPINAIWQTCYNRCRPPASYPQTGPCSPCERKILAVSVANEVGGGGFEMALDVAHIHLNRIADTRLNTSTIEEIIRRDQVSSGLLIGFNGDCSSNPTYGDLVYSFYTDSSRPVGSVGDIPKNIAVADQAVDYACSASQSDRTDNSLWFLASNDPTYIPNNLDPRATVMQDLANNSGCRAWWISLFSIPADINPNYSTPIAQRTESNGVVLLYTNFVAPTTYNLGGWAGCNVYCSDLNDASTCGLD
jgi:hypothetical protein